MFILSALCVLLPLAAALDKCDDAKVKAYLAKTKLEGNLLNNFGDRKFWFVAAGADETNSRDVSGEVTFGSVADNSVDGYLVFRNASGATNQESSLTYVLDGDRVLNRNGAVALYFFKASPNLIGGYRCETGGESGASASQYLIWAAWEKTDADVSGEIASAKAAIFEVDPSATLLDRVHP